MTQAVARTPRSTIGICAVATARARRRPGPGAGPRGPCGRLHQVTPGSGLRRPSSPCRSPTRRWPPGCGSGWRSVEAELFEHAQSRAPFVTEAARHLLAAGGKRFRPLLVLLAAEAGDRADSDEVITAACVVEITHVGSLYHDDVMDEADLRRGADSANSRWDNHVAILTGDFLFAKSSELTAAPRRGRGADPGRDLRPAGRGPDPRDGRARARRGPAAALPRRRRRQDRLADRHLGPLRRAASAAPARDVEQALTAYGEIVGSAFQLSDDILDIASESDESGKTPGTDLREGVPTLPVLMAQASDRPRRRPPARAARRRPHRRRAARRGARPAPQAPRHGRGPRLRRGPRRRGQGPADGPARGLRSARPSRPSPTPSRSARRERESGAARSIRARSSRRRSGSQDTLARRSLRRPTERLGLLRVGVSIRSLALATRPPRDRVVAGRGLDARPPRDQAAGVAATVRRSWLRWWLTASTVKHRDRDPHQRRSRPSGRGACPRGRRSTPRPNCRIGREVLQQPQRDHRDPGRGGAEADQRDGGDDPGGRVEQGVARRRWRRTRAAPLTPSQIDVRRGERGDHGGLEGQALDGAHVGGLLGQPVGAERERQHQRDVGESPVVPGQHADRDEARRPSPPTATRRSRSLSSTTPISTVTSGLMK